MKKKIVRDHMSTLDKEQKTELEALELVLNKMKQEKQQDSLKKLKQKNKNQ